MNKITGILLLLIYVCIASALLNEAFISPFNMQNIVRYSALYGIIGIGVSLVIITGGIDLSIGSLIGLTGCILPMLLIKCRWPAPAALGTVMIISLLLGLVHGLLITKLRMQPFIVTLCGLMIYRGLARWITQDQTQGFGTAYDNSLRLLATGKPCSIAFLTMLAGVATAVWCGWRWWFLRQDQEAASQSRTLAWSGALMGLVLAVVSSSRFWQGISFTTGPAWLALGPVELPTIAAAVPQQAAGWPQEFMGWCVLGTIPAAFWLLMVVAHGKTVRVAFPLIALVVTGVMVWQATRIVHQPDEWFWPNATWADRWRMGSVFLALGLLLASLGWFFRSALVATAGAALPPLTLGGFFGILWLLGRTPLGQTLVPAPVIILIVLAAAAAVFLNQTIYGRYLLALGRNEEAARYCGINTDRMIILAYVLCSGAAGLGGILFALDGNSVQPASHGNFLELYAIAAAVLGGCSLRGGEGSIFGVIIGAAIMRVLYNSINILGIPPQLEFAIIGGVILCGVLADELVKRFRTSRWDGNAST